MIGAKSLDMVLALKFLIVFTERSALYHSIKQLCHTG